MGASLAKHERLPVWASRCTWRDELDVRAGQLERISLEFDKTKRSLDAANEELQWQATSAEALRMRLADVVRASRNEDLKTNEHRESCQRSFDAVEGLVHDWSSESSTSAMKDKEGNSLPLVVQQARWLLESIRRSEVAESSLQTKSDGKVEGAVASTEVAS